MAKYAKEWNRSVFFLTINSNRNLGRLPAEQKRFVDTVSQVLSEDLFYYLRTLVVEDKAPGQLGEAGVPVPGLVGDIEVDLEPEIGGLKHRYHVHANVNIAHKTLLQIDKPALQEEIARRLGYNIYMDKIHGYTNHEREREDYLRKQQLGGGRKFHARIPGR